MSLCTISTIVVRGRREEKREGARRERGKKRERECHHFLYSFSVLPVQKQAASLPTKKERQTLQKKFIWLNE